MNYEEAAKRLEEIIAKLESGTISMSEALTLFEEGEKLAKVCFNELNAAKGKLTEVKEELGKLTITAQD